MASIPTTDFELTQLVAQGDEAAFNELYKRYYKRVHSVCLRMIRDASKAEDLTQEAFIQLFCKAGGFRGESAFAT